MREPGVSRAPKATRRKSISAAVSTLITHGSTREYLDGTRTAACSSSMTAPWHQPPTGPGAAARRWSAAGARRGGVGPRRHQVGHGLAGVAGGDQPLAHE